MLRTRTKTSGLICALTLAIGQLASMAGAYAQGNGISISLAASEPTSYNHATGGGYWNLARENVDIRKSLEGENFRCNDKVSYLTNIAVPNTTDLKALGLMTVDLNYTISMDTTGQSGVALGETVTSMINTGDPAMVGNSNSTASIVSTSQSGASFSKGAELYKTVRVTGVEAGEVIIVRVDTKLLCQQGSMPTGNLQMRLTSASLVAKNGGTPVNPPEQINVGDQTISLKNVQTLEVPNVRLSKTVTTSSGTCPGEKSILIEPTQEIKFCYAVSNIATSSETILGPLFNVSAIHDDNGKYPDFDVTLTSGLTDIDKDGQADDLAPGATAYGSYVIALDGDQDTVVTNLAIVTGYGQSNGGIQYSASDTATVFIDAPAPAMTLNKLTNGSDSSTVLVGTPLTWSYEVTNTGDRLLTNVYVLDDQGVTVVCPSTQLAIGAAMTCTATGVAVAGNYTNVGTAYGTWDSTQASASDWSSYFGANPKVDIQKSPDTQTVTEGKSATFTIVVTNTGNVALTGVAVSDALSPDCVKSIGAMAAGAVSTYTCTSAAITQELTNIASVVGYYGTLQVTDSDDAKVLVHYLPKIKVTKSVDKASVVETGETVTFTVAIKNLVPHDFVMTSLSDDKFGDLNGKGSCALPQTISGNATYSCSFQALLASDSLTAHIDVVTANGHDLEDNLATGTDTATVTFLDVLPNITVKKTANPGQISEAGGDVTFTYLVTNKSLEAVLITSLVDDKLGDLNGKGTCVTPQAIVGLGSYSCAFTKRIGDWTTTPITNIVVVIGEDNDGNKTSASDSATVTFTDIVPTISMTKTVNPTAIRASGDYVDYTITITNTGLETVTVLTLTDPKIVLSAECLALIGKVIAPAGSLQCTVHIFMYVAPGTTFVNTASATASDNEGNVALASASASLKSYWYGRSPGYWKNHPESWVSGYLPSQFVQNIFTIPSTLLNAGVLDLDGNKAKDTLISGLAYKGGAGLSGAAQILLRASIAALLNEAYYGADFPAEISVGALISHVNSVLATQNRDMYLALAAEYDKWNNGTESPLP